MNTLDKIIQFKRKEVEEQKLLNPLKTLEQSDFFNLPTISFKEHLENENKVGIIAEFKRKSPSKGIINANAEVEKTTVGYVQAGASALSLLTDTEFFGGSNSDLSAARKLNTCPILRKEFIVDEYQIIEAKSIGADVILLLANVLNAQQIKDFSRLAKSLEMEILLEIRDKEELESVNELVDVVGVNNRNLKDFSVNISQSQDLAELIPSEFLKISESGIDSPETIIKLQNAGFKGFLMGETFMKESQPELACQAFIQKVNALKVSL